MYYLLVSIFSLFIVFLIEKRYSKYRCISSIKDVNIVKLIFISLMFVSSMVFILIKLERWGFLTLGSEEFSLAIIPYMLYTTIMVPVVEEYFYRFIALGYIKEKNIFIKVIGVILVSVLFSYFHSLEFFTYIIVFLMSVILSVIFLKTNNYFYSLGCHSLYNLVMLLIKYFHFRSSFLFFVVFVFSSVILFKLSNKEC